MIIYSDGSASPNPGKGGFGVVVLSDVEEYITCYSKHCDITTNNAEELKAIIWALYNYGGCNPVVYSDSAYAINSLTVWKDNWKMNGWLKSDGKPPENLELIKAYDRLWADGFRIQLKKVKGHSNNKWNDMADKLAKGEIRIK